MDVIDGSRCSSGVVGRILMVLPNRRGVTKLIVSRIVLERLIIEGDNPVGENIQSPLIRTRVRRDTRNPVGIWGDHPPRLNTPEQPIVNKYREGKVKSSPKGK